MRALRRYFTLGPSLAAAIIVITLLAPVAAAEAALTSAGVSTPIKFEINVFESCFDGWASDYSTASIVWRDSSGAVKSQAQVPTSEYGYYQFCSGDPDTWVEPGDRIKVSDGTFVRKFTVPNLTLMLNRESDMVLGTGPASRTVRLCSEWSRFYGSPEGPECHGVRVGADGTWSYEPKNEMIGGIGASVSWWSPKGDLIHASATAPYVAVTLGKAALTGMTTPRVGIDLIVDGATDGAAHLVSDGYGSFAGQFRDAQGRLVSIAAGDHITSPNLASNEDWIVPNITGSVDKVSDILTGKCFDTGTSDGSVIVAVMRSGQIRERALAHTRPNGSFTLDFNNIPPFGSSLNIRAGDRVLISCMQTTGDLAQKGFLVY